MNSTTARPAAALRPVPAERRHGVRKPCRLSATWRPFGLVNVSPRPATVQDLSATGLRMCSDHPVEAGTIVVQLQAADGRYAVEKLVRVQHRQPNGAGCLLGGRFVKRLAPEEVTWLSEMYWS